MARKRVCTSASKVPPSVTIPAGSNATLVHIFSVRTSLDSADPLRDVSLLYTRTTAVLFVAIMMGPIVAYRDKYPHFLPLPLVLAPFLVAFFFLLLCVFPRYPRSGRNNFLVTPNPSKKDFVFVENSGDDLDSLKLRCSILSRILFWKTLCLNISVYICLVTIVIIFILLSYSLLWVAS